MRRALIILFLLSTCSCASSPKVLTGPCDLVMNRQDLWVCGEREVLQKCRPVEARSEMVCDPL